MVSAWDGDAVAAVAVAVDRLQEARDVHDPRVQRAVVRARAGNQVDRRHPRAGGRRAEDHVADLEGALGRGCAGRRRHVVELAEAVGDPGGRIRPRAAGVAQVTDGRIDELSLHCIRGDRRGTATGAVVAPPPPHPAANTVSRASSAVLGSLESIVYPLWKLLECTAVRMHPIESRRPMPDRSVRSAAAARHRPIGGSVAYCENRAAMKCLLVDDHALVRDALALLIALQHPDVDLRHAGRLREARAVLEAEPDVDLVLLDLALPDSSGLDTLSRPCGRPRRTTRPVVLSADDRPETVFTAIDGGAAGGFIPKATESRLLREALATVLRGGVYVPAVALAASPAPHGQPASTEHLGLTQRQIEVLRMLVDGRSNKLIARELDLAPSTVKTHLEAIFQRLHVNSRTQAVVAAARLGLRL